MRKPPPNIVLITTDQQHPNLLGCLNPELRTPHLDRLAAEGTLFTRAYCPNPTCTPTRASIITGLYPSQHGAYSLGTTLSERVPTLGGLLHDRGYATALVGKAHFQALAATPAHPSLESYPILQDLDFWRAYHGPFYGFEHVELARNHADEAHVGQHYALWMEQRGAHDWRRYFRPPTGTQPQQHGGWNIPVDLHYNTWIAERTNALLEQYGAANGPFFLWASFFDPHPPYLVPAPYDTMYDPARVTVPGVTPGEHDRNPPHFQKTQEADPDFSRWTKDPRGNYCHGFHSHRRDRGQLARDIATYYGMMTFLDRAIGGILARLETLGLAQDTLVVFTSDHGHLHGQHGMTAKGAFHYEDLVRVPFIVRWPGRVPAGRRSSALQSLVDLAPGFLAAAGVPVPETMAGVDQTPVWQGARPSARDHVLVENRHQPSSLQLHTYVDARYKLTAYRDETYGELFDLQEDPGELHNLWSEPAAQPLKLTLLQKLVTAEMTKEPLNMPRVSAA
ncbi:MAG: sulfatase family protein [Opitutaceae bacterium]